MDEQNTINTDISSPSSGMSSCDKRVIIGTIALFVLCVTGYAFSVDNFKDYKPPSYLAIGWYDYYATSLKDTVSSDNKKTPWTRWSAEYPYRAMFLGSYPSSMQEQRYNAVVYIVWSKKPITDIFTFEFRDGDLSAGKKGRIRALYDKGITNRGDDVWFIT